MSDPSLRPPSYVPAAPVEPPRRRGPSLKLLLLLGLPVLLVAGVGTVVALAAGSSSGDADAAAEPSATWSYTPNPMLASLQSEREEKEAKEERVRTAIGTALTTQGAALLSGDKAKFVSLALPSAPRVTAWLNERFTTLRAMGVAQWNPSVSSLNVWPDLRGQANIEVKYCFVAGCPRPSTTTLHTMWNIADPANPTLTEMWASPSRGRTTEPWAQSPLRAVAGKRVVVATTPANAGRLAGTLAEAEKAAAVADQLAAAAKPGKYVIYLAGAKEWGKWPYGDEGKWVAGYANEDTESVVVNVPALKNIKLDFLLRHELAHIASLAGRSESVKRADSWWLSEGVAEWAAAGGKPFTTNFRRAETAAFVRTRWKGDLRVGEPSAKTTVRDASARYGTAHLAVACLMKTYGRQKALGFIQAVAVQGTPLPEAATQTLNTSWPTVTKTCAAEIRRTAK